MKWLILSTKELKGLLGIVWFFMITTALSWHVMMDTSGSENAFHQGQWVGAGVGFILGIATLIKERRNDKI